MSKFSRNSLVNGALITVVMRWIDRGIGIVSTLVLARILVPEDFGIVAMASLIVAFTSIIFDLGVNVAIIQRKDPSPNYYNTAWTLRLIQASCVAIALSALAPFAADYYHDYRVTDVIRVMSLTIVVSSLENIGIINFQKDLNFSEDAKFILFKRMVGFITTIIMTLVLSNYWGMILGSLCGTIFSSCRSYWIHPMRPKLCLSELREIFSISQWVLVKNISQYLDRNAHIFIVGGMGSTSVTGGYTLASEISDIPGTDLLAPINRVLFPAFAKARSDMAELTRLLVTAQSIQVMITFPTCVGFVMTAHEFVPIALGEKWMFIIPFIQILALSNIVQSISSSANYVLTVVGQIRLLALSSWIQIGLFGAGILIAWKYLNPEMVALFRLGAIVSTFGISYYMLTRFVPGISIISMIRGITRPVMGSAAIVITLLAIDATVNFQPAILLLLKIVVGVIAYVSVVLSMWYMAGKPDGAEAFLIRKIWRQPTSFAPTSNGQK